MRPLLLDLYCGGGGAAVGYHRAGFDVYGIDINRQTNYPFAFWQGDALLAIKPPFAARWREVRAIHASPPCQIHTRKAANWGRKRTHWLDHPDLIAPTRELLQDTGLPYVIENVPGSPVKCYNPWAGAGRSAAKLRAAVGIDWLPISGGASRKAGYTGDLFNAIPPAYTNWIGQGLIAALEKAA